MRVVARAMALASGAGFAITSLVVGSALRGRYSVGWILADIVDLEWRYLLERFMPEIVALFVGYLIWGAFLHRPIPTRRTALVVGSCVGLLTALFCPIVLGAGVFLRAFVSYFRNQSSSPLDLSLLVPVVLIALAPSVILVVPFSVIGWLTGWLVPLSNGSNPTDTSSLSAATGTDSKPAPSLRGGPGIDPPHVVVEPATQRWHAPEGPRHAP